jgi:hypothetical protein
LFRLTNGLRLNDVFVIVSQTGCDRDGVSGRRGITREDFD